MSWVVIDDPVPTGASHLGGDAGASAPDDADALPPDFVERSFASWRAYYGWVPAGRFTAAYTIRLNQPGTFELPPTRVEAMYAPDLFGEAPNATWEVR